MLSFCLLLFRFASITQPIMKIIFKEDYIMKEKLLKIYNSDTALARTQGVVIGLMVATIIVNAINKIKD